MRWLTLVVACVAVATTLAGPDPKKYKPEVKTKDKTTTPTPTALSDAERKFLRDVESKFGVKPKPQQKDDNKPTEESKKPQPINVEKPPFPAVIAIEIVNDTDSKTKGKRTIDANLGYGYRTNTGYTYTYFGKSNQDKGKFMVYPYSQEDIPPANSNYHSHTQTHYSSQQSHGYSQSHQPKTTKLSASVEITPSQAYELVPTSKEEEQSYQYEKPSGDDYSNVKSVESPPPQYPASHQSSSTLYTTYNGKDFSGLSGQFPQVMSNYLVDPSQLVNSPQYQSAGLTQDYISSHSPAQQRVVPVLVLRIPSSYIKNPSAELYANLPQNQPASQYLNHLNLQELVNQYFKKIGLSNAPQVMAYPSSSLTHGGPSQQSSYYNSPQHYAAPYVRPSYSQAQYSGVQYSAVQPVMATYPSGHTHQLYMSRGQLYQHQQPQYMYRYRYMPETTVQEAYYQKQQYQQQQEAYQTPSQEYQQEEVSGHEASNEYSAQQGTHEDHDSVQVTAQPQVHQEYAEQAPTATPAYESAYTASPGYEHSTAAPSAEYGPTSSPHLGGSVQVSYEQPQKETIAVYSRGQTGHNYDVHSSSDSANYEYQHQNQQSSGDDLVLTENYPSKDHTLATVLPLNYQSNQQSMQAVSYVTPEPGKFHSKFRVMVPQTVFKNPNSEKVTYVNSHSLHGYDHTRASSYSGEGYLPSSQYASVGRQKSSSEIYNYHAHPKRMARPASLKTSSTRKHSQKNANKKSAQIKSSS